ncbi:unnamed protein product [Notodromas monacha]|uniref:Metalloendopeptidase n=1 Tax=Notodromas monacha TaxID=399045 RepID=A0A7R9BGF7_9CRUS|nr:unnamed protein product [Notodromas monacha]CAG0914154.1 unnamed protein product [Notodromas monacha]
MDFPELERGRKRKLSDVRVSNCFKKYKRRKHFHNAASKLPNERENIPGSESRGHCNGCLCPHPSSLDVGYSKCSDAIRSLAAECAKTEEQLQSQLHTLKLQLESKDSYRGKNMIPTVLHRLREYMDTSKKLHKRLIEKEQETRQTEPLGMVNHTQHLRIGKDDSFESAKGSHDHHESVHKHDLVEAMADAAKKVMEALHSLVNNMSDEKFKSAFDFEKTFNREILPSTFAYALPIKALLDMCPLVLFEADSVGKRKHEKNLRKEATPIRDSILKRNEYLKTREHRIAEIRKYLKQTRRNSAHQLLSNLNASTKDLSVQYWPHATIPFQIDENFSAHERRKIIRAMNIFNKRTAVNFVPKSEQDANYVHVRLGKDDELCSSNIGMLGGMQEIVLNKLCMGHGSILHELNHVVGFEHEHSRSDRDKYVHINWDMVMEGAEKNFQRHEKRDVLSYDYYSIMHYPCDAFSRDEKQPTIIPRDSKVEIRKLGQRRTLSHLDVEKINWIYAGNLETRYEFGNKSSS